MSDSTPSLVYGQDTTSENRADFTVHIPGNSKHFVSAEVLMSHLRLALKTTTLSGGRHTITITHNGSVFVDGGFVYAPKTLTSKVAS